MASGRPGRGRAIARGGGMSSTDRIAQLEQEATAAIAAASATTALEEVRVRYLGRKAELPNLLRSVAELPPEERAATRKGADQARPALEGALEARWGGTG